MKLKINGKVKTFSETLSVSCLIDELKLNSERVVIELNSDILQKEKWDSTKLRNDDKLEIVSFVGGG